MHKSLRALIADNLAIRNIEALQNRTAGTQCTQCLKAFIADQLAKVDVLQTGQPALDARNA